jgi:hypothetical protein
MHPKEAIRSKTFVSIPGWYMLLRFWKSAYNSAFLNTHLQLRKGEFGVNFSIFLALEPNSQEMAQKILKILFCKFKQKITGIRFIFPKTILIDVHNLGTNVWLFSYVYMYM